MLESGSIDLIERGSSVNEYKGRSRRKSAKRAFNGCFLNYLSLEVDSFDFIERDSTLIEYETRCLGQKRKMGV
jgi:hypothetical protein